jgi:hypothetical protein
MNKPIRNGETGFGEFLSAANYFSSYLLDGATADMAVDGSGTPVIYRYTVPSDTKIALTRCLLSIEHGAAAFVASNFGARAALANGLEISVTPLGGAKIILENWKTNRQVRDTMFDFDQTFRTDGVYTGRWTFSKDLNEEGMLVVPGDVVEIKVQDNLSTLDYLSLRIKGKKKVVS